MTRQLYRIDYEEAGPYTGNESEFTVSSADSAFECALQVLRSYDYYGPAIFRIIYGPAKDINVVQKVCADCMTFNPYAGLDGAKRLELLEELAAALAHWRRVGHLEVLNLVANFRLMDAEAAIKRDNERVDRLNQGQVFDEVIKDFKVPLRGLGKDKKT